MSVSLGNGSGGKQVVAVDRLAVDEAAVGVERI
jgi:hypothetical protein